MKAYYDLHMHTCLSPCAHEDMTPNNVVNMSMIKGLDIIAITDHNSIANCKAAMEVGVKRDMLVIPGMELQTMEDIHLVCLFKNLEDAERFYALVDEKRMKLPNKKERFGEQVIMNSMDEPVGEEPYMLITSVMMDITAAFREVRALGGIIFPAHIDRPANSVINNLGFLPQDLNIGIVEISRHDSAKSYLEDPQYQDKLILRNSDAHDLMMINEREHYIELDELTIECFFDTLSRLGEQ